MRFLFSIAIVAFAGFFVRSTEAADCRGVKDESFIQINKVSLDAFQKAGLSRGTIFTLLKSVAQTETSGCWAGVSENFDGQLVSVGVLQWNYGQNSVQPLLKKFKRSMGDQFHAFLQGKMPTFGSAIFSEKCLSDKIQNQAHPCAIEFLDPADERGHRLKAGIATEFKNLFEDDGMIQIQMDHVMAVMEKTLDFSKRLFGENFGSVKDFHWMLDTIVQQGGVEDLENFKKDVDRAWKYAKSQGPEQQAMTAKGILLWYAGHAASPDQGGLDCDWRYNIEKWTQLINSGAMDDEKFRLFLMSWMRARTAKGESGRWQALSFERRAKLGVDVGSVGHSSVQRDNNYDCAMPKPKDFSVIIDTIRR